MKAKILTARTVAGEKLSSLKKMVSGRIAQIRKGKSTTSLSFRKKLEANVAKTKRTFLIRISLKDQIFFAKRLSFLSKAGVPLLEGLTMIREQTRSKGYGRIMDSVILDVSNGQSLSKSIGKFRRVFGDFAINIIGVGESTGILSENLEYLAAELKNRHSLRSKVVSAFVYPVIVTLATIGITIFLMVYLFPKIMPVFSSLHMTLPLSTRIVIWMSTTLQHDWLWLLISGIVAIIAGVVSLQKSEWVREHFHWLILRIPLLGKMFQSYVIANATRTMGLLLKSGLPLSEVLPITAKTTMNLVYRREFRHLSDAVNRGERLSSYLKKDRKLFPDLLTQILAVGERSGNLSNSLIYVSEIYANEVDEFTKNLSSLIEPALMIFMGVLVGFIAVSIITPIYGITQNLRP